MKPSQEKIEFIKSQFPDRALFTVDAVAVEKDAEGRVLDEDGVVTFVMTSPTREEYKFFVNKMIAAKETKDEADRLWAIRNAVENAALAQIRWPDREEAKRIFDSRPEMVDGFAAELQKAAGNNIELRSKKL